MNLKKSEKTVSFVVSLALISVVCASLLSVVYGITKPKIEEAKEQAKVDAAKLVLPADSEITLTEKNGTEYFEAKSNGSISGYAFMTETNIGYGGNIKVLMGIDTKCNISGFKIMEHQETPGLGTQADLPKFKDQFKGKGLNNFKLAVKQDGGDVDAITAATISSRAVTDSLKKGLEKFSKIISCNTK